MAGELFTDNPLIGSMYHALGMGGLLPGNAAPAAATGATPPPKVAPGRSKPNIAPYRNRPYIARLIDPRMESRGVQPGGVGMLGNPEETMMDPNTLRSPEVQALLGRFGVQTTGGYDPNLFMHNQDFNTNHPKIAGAMEGALSGLAFTQGGNTIGESLSNVARGMMESQGAHAEHINAQLMAPFQQAQGIALLQNEAGQMDERQASIAHMQSMSDYYAQMAKNHANEEELRQQALDEKKRADQAVEDLKDENNDPMHVFGHLYLQGKQREWAQKYPNGQIPPEEIMKAASLFNNMNWAPREAWHAGAQNRSNERLSLEERRAQIQEVQREVDYAQKQLDSHQKLGNMYLNQAGTGVLMPGTPEFQQEIGRYQDIVDRGTKIARNLSGNDNLWTGPTGGSGNSNVPPPGATIIDSSAIK